MITHLHKMTFFLLSHPKSFPVTVLSHETSLSLLFERSTLLPTAFSQSTTFFFPFYSSYNQQFLDTVCKINNPLYETAQIGNVTFWFFFVGWGEFYCVFIKHPKKKANIKYSKVTCCFLHFQTRIKLLQAGMRTQQVLLILMQDEDFNARHDITIFACATSSGFIPFSFVLTQMILSNIVWSLF